MKTKLRIQDIVQYMDFIRDTKEQAERLKIDHNLRLELIYLLDELHEKILKKFDAEYEL